MDKNEAQEMTESQLKEVISEAVADSAVAQEVADLKSQIATLQATKSVNDVEARAEVSKKFINDIVSGNTAEMKTITTDDGSFGYSVPTELASAVHEKKDKISVMRNRAFVFTMAGKFDLPTEGTAVTSYWITTEADADITESNPTLGKKSLDDWYLASRVKIPRKLLSTTGINLQNYVSSLASRSIVNTEETAFVGGDGSEKPTGFRQATVDSIAQSGSALTYDDVINLVFSLGLQYRAGATILTSTLGVKALLKIKDDQGVPIFKMGEKLLGKYEVLEVTDIPENLGTSADTTEMWIADLKEYWIKDGEQMLAEVNKVPGRLQVEMIMYEATDGLVVNADAFKKMTAVK